MKKLVIISVGYNTAHTIYEQLCNILYSSVDIKYYYSSSPPPTNLEVDLILYSSEYAFERINFRPANVPYIIARRSINYHEISKLFKLPKYSDVLLVNDSKDSAEETILLLQALGIDHINYYPYYPGIDNYPKLKIAITPGETEHVPGFVNHIIDIKTRLVDITSIIEILTHFDILDKFANILSAKYIQDIIKLIKYIFFIF